MKKIILVLLTLTVFFGSCRNLTDDDAYSSELKKLEVEAHDSDVITTETLTEKKVDFYYVKDDDLKCDTQAVALYFEQNVEIPYVEVKSFLNWWLGKNDISIKKEGKKYILSRPWRENCNLTIDFSTGEIAYSDYDYFCCASTAAASNDVITNNTVLKRWKIMDIQAAKAYTRNLNDYGIPFKYEGGHGFLPIEVAELITNCANHIVYNGKAVFLETDASCNNSDYSSTFSNPKETWSEAFGKYSYNFLCLAMDMKYGRKAYKGITGFDNWLTSSGLKDALNSTTVADSEKALGTMLLTNIGDLHTYYIHLTPYLSSDGKLVTKKNVAANLNVEKNSSSIRYENNAENLQEIMSKKAKAFMYWDTGNPGYDTNEVDEEGNVKDKIMNIFIPRSTGTTITDSSKLNTIFLTFNNFISSGRYADYKANWAYNQIGGKTKNDGVYFYKSAGGTGNLAEDPSITNVDGFINAINANPGNGYGISFKNELDTVLLTVVSNYIIKKLNEKNLADSTANPRKIDNVVLDLSRNGGGLCDDEVFISSWFLGQADNHIKNTITGSSSTVSFISDVDFDGKYNDLYQYAAYERTNDASKINDSNDTVCNLKRYCITSLKSFSCGNLMPVHIAEKDTVTIIGKKSGGGTCAVVSIEMPSGTRFSTSSPWQFSRLVNGAPVDIDDGTLPDDGLATSDFDKIYDREEFCRTHIK